MTCITQQGEICAKNTRADDDRTIFLIENGALHGQHDI
jgi:hypothetical protein